MRSGNNSPTEQEVGHLDSTHSGLRLRALRRGRGLSQTALASVSGLTQQRVSMIENGEERMWPGYARRLAHALGVTDADLLI